MASELSNGAGLGVLAFLMTYAVHSTVVMAAVWLAIRTRAVRAASTEDVLWKVALVGPVLTALLQTGAGLRPLAGGWDLSPTPSVTDVPRAGFPTSSALRLVPMAPRTAPNPGGRPERTGRLHRVAAPAGARATAAPLVLEHTSSGATSPSRGLAATALAAWLLLASLGLVRVARRHGRLRRLLAGREPVTDGWPLAALARLCSAARLRRRARLTRCERVPSPIALGRSEICVPPRALRELDPRQQEAMLAHELAHLVRRDPLWLTLCSVLEAIFFFQPLNALARRRMQANAEFLCDDWAARRSGAGVLARCLAQVAGWIDAERRPLPAPGMARRDSTLVRRVQRLADGSSGPRAARRASVLLGATCLLAAVSCGVPGVVAGDSDEPGLLERVASAARRWLHPFEARAEEARRTEAILASSRAWPSPEDEELEAIERSLAQFLTPVDTEGEPAVVRVPRGRLAGGEQLRPGRFHLVDENGVTVLVLEVEDDGADEPAELRAQHELRRAQQQLEREHDALRRELERAARGRTGDASEHERAEIERAIEAERRAAESRTREREAQRRQRSARGEQLEAEARQRDAERMQRDASAAQREAEQRALQREREQARALDRVSTELERLSSEYARAAEQLAREHQRALDAHARDLDAARGRAEQEYQRALEGWQREHEARGRSIETEWQRALEEAQREREGLWERSSGDQEEYERRLEEWEQAQEQWEDGYQEALDAWNEQSDEAYEALEERYADFEDRYEEFEERYEELDETFEERMAELEERYEEQYEQLEEQYEEITDQEWRDCDHSCSRRCRYGCTHPDSEADEADEETEPEEIEEEPAAPRGDLFVRAGAR